MPYQENSLPRIMGSETEYTTQFVCPDNNIRRLVPSKYILDDESQNEEVWLQNGGRLYIDYGDVLEYATPECRNAKQVAIHEQAGEQLVRDITTLVSKEEELTEYEQATAYKRSGYDRVLGKEGEVLLEPMSVGHHENYASFLHPGLSDFAKVALISYLATRPIWAGAGLVATNGYAISQKGSAINLDAHNTDAVTHGNKMGFSREEDERLEIRSGEGNMSEWQIVQKFAFTSLVLRLIENRRIPDRLLLPTMYAASFLQRLSYPMVAQTMDIAASHQRAFAYEGLELAKDYPNIPHEEVAAAEAIIETTEQIEAFTDNPKKLPLLSNRLDWAAKLAYIQSRNIPLEKISTSNLSAVSHDLKWENIALSGIARQWYKKVAHTKPDENILRQTLYQPPNTRAKARAEAIRLFGDRIHEINWSHVSGYNRYDVPTSFHLEDPSNPTLDLS